LRVISCTPAGRRRYLEALVPHLLAQRHVIDEHHWWLNTRDEGDIRYVYDLCAAYPAFFKVYHKPPEPQLNIGQNIWRFFAEHCEPDTIYLRFDDDIVFIAPDAVENLVRFRVAHPEAPLVVGNIVNNGVCSHFLQRAGVIPESWGEVENFCLDGNGWACPEFARKLHELFLGELAAGRLELWKLPELPINGFRRFSVNVISWFGEELAQVPEVHGGIVDEELFLTVDLPRRLGRPNAGCGDALFAHLAFFTQRPYLEWTWPQLIDHYREVAERGATAPSWTEPTLKLIRHTAWRYGRPVRKLRLSIEKRRNRAAQRRTQLRPAA
jgi:hypothetical protein